MTIIFSDGCPCRFVIPEFMWFLVTTFLQVREFLLLYNGISKKTKNYPKWRLGDVSRHRDFLVRYQVELSTQKFQVYHLDITPELFRESIHQKLRPVILSLCLEGYEKKFDPLTFLKPPNGSLIEELELYNIESIETKRLACLKSLGHLKRILIKTDVVPLMNDLLMILPLETTEFSLNTGKRLTKFSSFDFTSLTCFEQLTFLDLTLDEYGLATLCEGYLPNLKHVRVINKYESGNDSPNEKRDVCLFPDLRELVIVGELSFEKVLNISGPRLRYLTIVPYVHDNIYGHISDYDYTERVSLYGSGLNHKFYRLRKLMVPGDEYLLKLAYPNTEITTGELYLGADVFEDRRWPYYPFDWPSG